MSQPTTRTRTRTRTPRQTPTAPTAPTSTSQAPDIALTPDVLPASLQASQKAKIGRPRRFTDPEDLQAEIDAYFTTCDTSEPRRPYTISGLAEALDTSRSTLLRYLDGHYSPSEDEAPFIVAPAFRYALKRATAKCERRTEEDLLTRDRAPIGHIFSLKNNFGWKDTQEIHVQSQSVSLGIQLNEDQRRIIAEQLLSAGRAALSPHFRLRETST